MPAPRPTRHRRAGRAHPPDHVLRLRVQRPRRGAVQPGALGPRLLAHQQPDQRGARAARRGAGRRHRRHRHRQRPGGAAPEHRHPDGRGLAHRRQHGAVRRLAEPAALHAAPLRHRDHLRQAGRHRRLARRDPARDASCCSARPWATRAWTCWTSRTVAAIAHEAGVPLLVDSTLTSPLPDEAAATWAPTWSTTRPPSSSRAMAR